MDIRLTPEEFEHITSHKPGTCNCELCKWFWSQVGKWMESSP